MSAGLFLQRKFEKKMSPFFHIVKIHTNKRKSTTNVQEVPSNGVGNVTLCTSQRPRHKHTLALSVSCHVNNIKIKLL